MERLTDKREADQQRKNYEKRLEQGYPRNIPEERFLKLAAYEDTGLEPEEVETMRESKADAQFMLTELCRLCDYDRLEELAKAEQEGRMVVLPCKVGDWVYALWAVPTKAKYVIYCAEVKEIWISMRNCRLTTTYRLEPIEYRGRRREYLDEDFGKTVFLTPEEAEAALQRQEGDAINED